MKTKLLITTLLTAGILLFSGCSSDKDAVLETDAPKHIEITERSDNEPTIPEPTPMTGETINDTEESTQNSYEGSISVCIDAGHGITNRKDKEPVSPGSDEKKAANVSGTAGEEEFNLAVALKLREKLEKSGVSVDMTRTTPECDKSNIDRAQQGNDSDYCIRIHADGNSNSSLHGISVLVPKKSYYDDNTFVTKSNVLAQTVLNSLISATGAKNNGIVTRSDLTGFNWSKVPVILVECGFMTNPEERKLLESEEYKDKIAGAIANGFLNYINNQDN